MAVPSLRGSDPGRDRLARGGFRVAAIAVFAVVLVAASTYWYGDRIVAGLIGAEELPRAEAPALRSTVEPGGKGGIAPPRLYIVRDGFPRAFSAGRGPSAPPSA